MKVLTIYLTVIIASIFSMNGQTDETTNATLLQRDNIIITNSINTTSTPIDQSVVSIVDTEIQIAGNPISVYSHPQWNSQQIGNLTKCIYDEEGNIYVAASSAHISKSKVNSWRYGDIGGGADDLNAAGSIYRLDAYTGEVSVLTRLPQQQSLVGPIIFVTFSAQRLTGPGIADIAYDYENQQILAANYEDGKIYRTDKSGTLTNVYDPGLADDGTVGFAPEAERITAIATKGNKVYYAVSNNTSSFISSYKIKNNQTAQSNSEKIEITLSDIPEIANPHFPITDINIIEGNLISISQSNMLNEVTILADNLPTIILKKRSNTWQLEKLFNGSTDQVELSNKSNIQLVITEDNEDTKLWYGGSDIYKNNYLLSVAFENLPQMPNILTANYTTHQIPGLLGSIKTVHIVNEDRLVNLAKNNNEDENNGEAKNEDEDDNEDENSKITNSGLEIVVYPNPAQSFFQIKNLPTNQVEEIFLYSVNGKLLKFSNNTNTVVDVNDVKPGVYIVKVRTVDHNYTKKMIIQ